MSPVVTVGLEDSGQLKSKGVFSVMHSEIEAAQKLAIENLKVARSIKEALFGPCLIQQKGEKRVEIPGQIYVACSRLKEINGVLIELHDVLTQIKKQFVI